jgi:hypothetical protein
MLISEAKTHVIDGVTYVEVDRKAEVGDKVLIVNAEFSYGMYRNGDLITVERMDDTGIYNKSIACVGTGGSNSSGCIYHEEYLVLEPLENESSPQITDLIANLANHVHSLEQQLRDTQSNVEKLAEELATVKHLAHSNEQDIRTLDERTQPKDESAKSDVELLVEVWRDYFASERDAAQRTKLRLQALRRF